MGEEDWKELDCRVENNEMKQGKKNCKPGEEEENKGE